MTFYILMLSLLLSACSGITRVPLAETMNADPSRTSYYQPRIADPSQTALINIVRAHGFVGRSCYLAIMLNDQLIGRLDRGEKMTLTTNPGPAKLSLDSDPLGKGLCGMPNMYDASFINMDFQAGKTYHVQVGFDYIIFQVTNPLYIRAYDG